MDESPESLDPSCIVVGATGSYNGERKNMEKGKRKREKKHVYDNVYIVVVVAHVVAVVVVSVAVVLSISNLLYQMLSRAPLQNNMPRSSPPHQQS